MSRWRVVVFLFLIVAPVLIMAGVGSIYVWQEGLGLRFWWPMAGLMMLGYLLGWYWQRNQQLLRPVDFTPPPHGTDRDQQAWKIVEAQAGALKKVSPEQLGDLLFYVQTAQKLAQELSVLYHPGSADPLGNLTIPEILAVIELAAHDLAELVDQYLPAGDLLTINHWGQARQATEWYSTANNIYWAISAIFNPVNTGLRYAASQVGMARPWQMLQQNLIVWFFTAYLQRVGYYLIEVNSGRLRIGAERYRALVRAEAPDNHNAPPSTPAPEPIQPVARITLLVLGQVKAGKSSFINAVLGEQRAATDVLPATNAVSRYELQPKDVPTRLVLLDSPGYGHAGPKEDEIKATEEAARNADLLLLVLHATNPARQADLDMLERLRVWFASHPDLKMPPVLGILTHIDLLSPALEWAPPYDWSAPTRPKEHSIKAAWEAVREQLGSHLVGIVPVCVAAGRVCGIEEWFLPTLSELLDEARAVALLRCLRAEADTGKVRKVFQQLVAAGKGAVKVIVERPPPRGVR